MHCGEWRVAEIWASAGGERKGEKRKAKMKMWSKVATCTNGERCESACFVLMEQ